MNKLIKKALLAAAMTVFLGSTFVGSASASYYPTDITTLSAYLTASGASYTTANNSDLSGTLYFTPIAYEAAYTDQLKTGSTVLFTNTSLATEFGSVKSATASSTYFYDTNGKTSYYLSDAAHVDVYKLTKDWKLSNGLILTTGTFIIGLNDSYGTTCGSDFDDFILAASKTAPTPVPAAVWMLGSGLFGLMGVRRARKAGNV